MNKQLCTAMVISFLVSIVTLPLSGNIAVHAGDFTDLPVFNNSNKVLISAKSYLSQSKKGDWVITNNEVAQDTEILLDGNLIVKKGGRLTLRNVKLTLDCTYDGEYGIKVKSGGRIIIKNSVISTARDIGRYTFIVEENSGFKMRNSELHYCGYGTPYGTYDDTAGLAIYTNNVLIEKNLFSNNFNGIMLKEVSRPTISNNQFLENTWSGISMWNTKKARIEKNTFEDGYNGVWMYRCNNNIIEDNSFTSHFEGPIFLFTCWNNNIINNNMDGSANSSWVGVELDKVSGNNLVTNNTISGCMNGVNIHHSPNNTIKDNTITNAQTAIAMGYAHGNLIANNTCSDIGSSFTYGAMLLYHSSENQLLNNSIDMIGESGGMVLFGSSTSNTIKGNEIESTFRGISLHYNASSNSIISNTISAEQEEAIVVDNSSDNLIYHNNFAKSGYAPYDNSNNQWDDGSSGNYWHDYTGTGTYSISPNGVDHYPLGNSITDISVPVPELSSIPIESSYNSQSWVITEPTEITSQTVAIDELYIESGGSLTLTNSTLLIGEGSKYGDNITVESGGALYVYNSTITSTEEGGGYTFYVKTGSTLVIKESEVRGAGFSWGTDWGGLYINTDSVVIENTLFADTFRGLVINSSASGSHTVKGNTINSCYQGMSVSSQSNSLFDSNQVKDCIGWGINIDGSNNSITNNIITNIWSHSGLYIDGSNYTLSNNIITNIHSLHWGWGINAGGEGHSIKNNSISDVRSTALFMDGSNHTLSNNTITNIQSSEDCLVINANGEGHSIKNNSISDVIGTAISLNGENHTVTNNTITNTTYGVVLWKAYSNTIKENNITNTTDWAISLSESSDIYISNNTLSNSWGGVKLNNSSENNITSNQITQLSERGLEFDEESKNNTITGNTISNAPSGVFLQELSDDNLFYYNNFIDNTVQAEDYGSNQWNHEESGNYWSDYTGTDANDDGIGDTSYFINSNGVDHYPLMVSY